MVYLLTLAADCFLKCLNEVKKILSACPFPLFSVNVDLFEIKTRHNHFNAHMLHVKCVVVVLSKERRVQTCSFVLL